MSRPSHQEWERTKWYLARSMIDKAAVLSPIPETQEPSVDPLSPAGAGGGSLSPLPDLIVEKEPNRHDEPEEYYDFLEKRVVKYYRQLFYEFSDDEESNSSIGSNKPEEHSKSDIDKVTKFPSSKSTTSSQSERQSNARNGTTSTHRGSDISTHSEAERDNVIVTRAQIHHEVREEDISDNSRPGSSGASASGRGHRGSAGAAALSDIGDKNKQCDDDDVEAESEESCDSDDDESTVPEEPEIMRKRKSTSELLRDSQGDLEVRRYSSGDLATEGDVRVVFDREMEDAQDPAPTPSGVDEETNFEGEVELDLLRESDRDQEASSDNDEESDLSYEPEVKRKRKESSDSLEASDRNIGRRSSGGLITEESGDMPADGGGEVLRNSSRAERATPPTLSSYEKFIQNKLDNLRKHITEGTIKLCFCRDHVCRR